MAATPDADVLDPPTSVSPKKKLLVEGVWIALGQLISAAGLLIGIRILTEVVPPEVFGTVNLFLGIVTIGTSVLCGPQMQAALRFYPDLAGHGQTSRLRFAITSSLRWTTGGLAGLILLSGVVGVALGESYLVFIALAGLLVVEVFRLLELVLLTAARRQREYALWNAAENLARPFLGMATVLLMGPSPEALLTGYLLATGAVFLLFRWSIPLEGQDQLDGSADANASLVHEIWRYALPLVPLGLVAWVSSFSDRYIIGGFVGLEAAGIYTIAYGLISRPFLLVENVIELTLRPVYYEAVSAQNHDVERKTLRLWMALTLLAGISGTVLIFFLKDTLAFWILAAEYRQGAILMPWIALGYAFHAGSLVLEKPCYAYKRTGWVTIIQAAGGLASVAVGIPLVYSFGLTGAAVGVPIHFGIQFLVSILAKYVVENSQ